MLHQFFNVKFPVLGNAKILHLHSDSSTGQRKINYVLGYFMLQVSHGLHKDIVRHLIAVGHTKCRLDDGFGSIRQHIDGRADVLRMLEIK